MSSRWLNESNLSPFFIFCARVWQRPAGEGRRGGGTGDTGEQGQPWGRSFCSPNHTESSSHPKPGKVGLFWIRESQNSWSGSAGEQQNTPGTTGLGAALPAWPWWCHILHMENPNRSYSEVTQPLLRLCLGLCPSTSLPQPLQP